MGVPKPKGVSEFPAFANGPNGERKLFQSGPLPKGYTLGPAPSADKMVASGGARAAKGILPKGTPPIAKPVAAAATAPAAAAPAKAPLKGAAASAPAAAAAAVAPAPGQTITRAQIIEALNEAGIPFKPTDSTASLVEKLEEAAKGA